MMENEKRLIDANKIKYTEYRAGGGREYPENVVTEDEIAKMPTVDAVDVVRCKYCKYWSELKGKDSGKPVGYGDCRNHCGINGIAYEDSFCSYGERKTDV